MRRLTRSWYFFFILTCLFFFPSKRVLTRVTGLPTIVTSKVPRRIWESKQEQRWVTWSPCPSSCTHSLMPNDISLGHVDHSIQITWRRLLLQSCCTNFFSLVAGVESEWSDEEKERDFRYRERMAGYISFVGELFLARMLGANVIHGSVLPTLLNAPEGM